MTSDGLFLRDISKGYGNVVALKQTNLHVPNGSLLALLGPSGCGKTTTLRVIAGFEQPDTGQVIIDGVDLAGLPPNRRGLGMVFQDYSLFPHMTVGENVGFGLRMARVPAQEIKARVGEMLELVHLGGYESRYPNQLSGGQKQRVALARSMITRPSVLLLDEPLGALDKNLRENMQFELRRLQQTLGITTILVTHDQDEALTLSDHIAVMNEGRILQTGTPTEVYGSPGSRFVAEFLGATNFFQGKLHRNGSGGPASFAVDRDGGEPLTFAVADEAGLADGPVLVGIRPERIVLHEQPVADMNSLAATVTGYVFRGAYHAYELSCAGSTSPMLVFQQADRESARRIFPIGSSVWMAWQMDDCFLLEPETLQ